MRRLRVNRLPRSGPGGDCAASWLEQQNCDGHAVTGTVRLQLPGPGSVIPELSRAFTLPNVVSISKTIRRVAIFLLAGMLVFAQAMIAAHACTVVQARSAEVQVPVQSTESGAMQEASNDTGFAPSNLCTGHCQPAQPYVVEPTASTPPVVLLEAFFPLQLVTWSRALGQPYPHAAEAPAAPVDPPHSILHCCLRI